MKQYAFNFVIVGHERIVGTPQHMETYKAFIGDMKQTLMGIVQSDSYKAAMGEVKTRYSESASHYTYKAGIMAASNACAEKMNQKWTGRIRNAPLNMVENCQTMFMHLVVLDP